MNKYCGYLNPNKDCNFTGLCDEITCQSILSNFENVENKAMRQINNARESLKELIIRIKEYAEVKNV